MPVGTHLMSDVAGCRRRGMPVKSSLMRAIAGGEMPAEIAEKKSGGSLEPSDFLIRDFGLGYLRLTPMTLERLPALTRITYWPAGTWESERLPETLEISISF